MLSAFSSGSAIPWVVTLAFLFRAVWLIRPGSDWAFSPDSALFVALAGGLRHGCGFAPYAAGTCGTPEVLRTPGYPVFLIPFGADYRAAILAQAVLGAFVCWLVARFVARSYGPVAGIVAAAFVAIDIPTILNTKELMSEALFQALATLAIFSALRQRGLICGALLAASIFVRPVALVLLPVVAIAFGVKRNWRGGIAAIAIAMLTVGGWCARNYSVAGVFTPSVEGEWNLYLYTAPAVMARHDRISFLSAQERFGRELEAMVSARHPGTKLGSTSILHPWDVTMNAETSKFLMSTAIATIVRHPIDFAVVTIEGFTRQAFMPYRLETGWRGLIVNDTAIDAIRILTGVVDGAMLLMLWAGALRSMTQAPRDSARWVLLGAAALLILAAAPYHGSFGRRYRSPAIPFLAVLAGIGWAPKRGYNPGHALNQLSGVAI